MKRFDDISDAGNDGIYFSFSFTDAVQMMRIMMKLIANKSSLRATCSNIDTLVMLLSFTETLTPKNC